MQASDKEMVVQFNYPRDRTRDLSATMLGPGKVHGVTSASPWQALWNGRIAKLKGGGSIGVRAPMRGDEEPWVRPYILVSDIDAAVKAAEASGAEILPCYPTEIPGHGKFAIYFQGGIQFGLWEL